MDKRLFLFDLDDTIIAGHIKPKRPYNEIVVLPGRKARLQALLAAGKQLAFVTNQRGVAFGYYSIDDVWRKLLHVATLLDLERYERTVEMWYVCVHDVRGNWPWNDPAYAAWAKPAPTLIVQATESFGISPLQTVMIGDRQDDQAAADRAGVCFLWTHEFFEDAHGHG